MTQWKARMEAGRYLLDKFRHQRQESGVYVAARNLKKQGVPLELALLLLRAT